MMLKFLQALTVFLFVMAVFLSALFTAMFFDSLDLIEGIAGLLYGLCAFRYGWLLSEDMIAKKSK